MISLTFPRFAPANTKPGLDISPVTRSAVLFAGAMLTLASAIAVLRWATGFAPDYAGYRNLAITLHITTVIPAVPLGAYLLLARKGTAKHKLLGRVWIGLMVTTAVAITFSRGGTDFSWIHVFVPYTIVGAWKVVATARRHDLVGHRKHLVGMYLGALAIPGALAFLPDRLMGIWLLG